MVAAPYAGLRAAPRKQYGDLAWDFSRHTADASRMPFVSQGGEAWSGYSKASSPKRISRPGPQQAQEEELLSTPRQANRSLAYPESRDGYLYLQGKREDATSGAS